ncbi:putative MFS transporter [Peribacillus sp. B2I2]|uniref:MFS transporter n=1 Tax=unclassified Peribacillus TaxID=2675266 RepID=UPI0025A0F178|nr:MFS transporter [Peribacillus sp. ACCC06369]MDM5358420.1 MFS transporter [Peribacillus sp. ACCC06369]
MEATISQRLDRLPVKKIHKTATILIGTALFFEFFEVFLTGVLASVLQNEFQIDKGLMPLMLGSSFFGMFFGAIFLSRVADKYGRKKAFVINLSIYSVFTFLIALSPDVTFIILFRFLAGVGLGAQPPLCATYLSEILPASKRGKFIAWAYTIAFLAIPIEGFLARLLVPLTPLGIDGWRWMFIIGSIGAIIVFLRIKKLPESPRWLELDGRKDKAEEIMKQFEGNDNCVSETPLKQITSPAKAKVAQHAPFSAIFQKQYIRRTLMMYIFQIFQTVGYYGFGTLAPIILSSKGYTVTSSLEYTALSFLGYPLGSLLAVPLIERIDRKWLIVLTAFGMGVFGMTFGMAETPFLIVFAGFLFTVVSNIFTSTFNVFQAEIFPTSIRATASGSAYSLSRLTSGLLPFILLPVLHASGATTVFMIIAAAMLILILDIAILAPRTTGISLDNVEESTHAS